MVNGALTVVYVDKHDWTRCPIATVIFPRVEGTTVTVPIVAATVREVVAAACRAKSVPLSCVLCAMVDGDPAPVPFDQMNGVSISDNCVITVLEQCHNNAAALCSE